MAATADSVRYDDKSIGLHWITAIVVLALWCLGKTIDWFPQGTPRIAARSTHIVLGTTLAFLLIYRIWWRMTAGARLPPLGSGPIDRLSSFAHFLLYGLLIAVVSLGLANAWARGDNIFNLFTLPALDPGNKLLRHRIEDLHGLCADILLILAGLHASAGLVHHYLLGDTVLRRMWPRR